jgi:CheY-like chemotaxis protein
MIAPLDRAEDEAVRRSAAQVSDLIRLSIDASRSLTGELSPPILHEGGLIPALEWLACWMQEKHGLRVDLKFDSRAAPQNKEVTILLFQAVRELLFNAVKHADVKSARVKVIVINGQMEVTVTDDGVGFDSTQLRLGGKTWGGFGLFSIRERLSYLGGRMEILSSPGRGSRFTLRVPVPLSTTPATAGEVTQGSPGGAAPESDPTRMIKKKIRVLLADDHRLTRQGLAHLLMEEEDIEIVGEAVDGETAVNLARQLLPNVIIMDISMPGMNGIEATRLIHAELPDIQVIGLSMYGESERAAAMRDAGAAAYLTKSGATDAVIAAIRVCAGNAVEAPLQRLQSESGK